MFTIRSVNLHWITGWISRRKSPPTDPFRSMSAGRAMFLVHNERTKLTANWLNTIATAIIATGALAPIAASIYGISQPSHSWLALLLLSAACFALCAFLHILGRLALRRLQV